MKQKQEHTHCNANARNVPVPLVEFEKTCEFCLLVVFNNRPIERFLKRGMCSFFSFMVNENETYQNGEKTLDRALLFDMRLFLLFVF